METAQPDLTDLDQQLLERVWSSTLLMTSLLTPLSLLRAFDTGWLPIYWVHALLLLGMWIAQLLRKRIAARRRTMMALVYIEVAGCLGVFAMGFMGWGGLWLAGASYLVGAVFGFRAGVAAIGVNLAVMTIAMLGFRSGLMTLPVDPQMYMRSGYAWLLGIVMLAAFPWVMLRSVVVYKEAVVELLHTREHQQAEILRLASHDALTGLVQARVARDRLDNAISRAHRSGQGIAVLFVDLDGFKAVNDSSGHLAGDHLLKAVASVLRAVVREGDTVARLGGDEFLLVLEGSSSHAVAAQVAVRILEELERPVVYRDTALRVSASIGVALYPQDGAATDDLLRAADSAMYVVKRQGKGGLQFSAGRADSALPP